MKQSKKFIASLSIGICVFFTTLSLTFIAYLYVKRNEPILYPQSNNPNFNYVTDWFIQNPFRDKTKELIADKFLNSIKAKTVTESLEEKKDVDFNDPENRFEKGKLVKWELWNRFDKENETEFYYAIYREDELSKPKRGKYLMSIVVLKLNTENSEWKVTKYTCVGISNNS